MLFLYPRGTRARPTEILQAMARTTPLADAAFHGQCVRCASARTLRARACSGCAMIGCGHRSSGAQVPV